MPARIKNLDKPKTQRAKTQRRGRKPAAPSKIHKTPPGRGATRLRNSVNSLVGQQADEIAQALIDKTKAGNMTGARILVELSGAGKPPEPVNKKHGGLKLIDLLESDSEWDFDTDPDTPQPGCEWNGERWVRPEAKS